MPQLFIMLYHRGHSAMVTAAGEPLLVGRSHDFGNTLRLINLHRGPSWFASVINFISDNLWKTDITPRLAFEDSSAAQPFVKVATAAGPNTAFLSCMYVCMHACMYVCMHACA